MYYLYVNFFPVRLLDEFFLKQSLNVQKWLSRSERTGELLQTMLSRPSMRGIGVSRFGLRNCLLF